MKQFQNHSALSILDECIQTFRYFLTVPALSPTNTAKLETLQHALIESLHTAVDGKDVESSAFEEDEVLVIAGLGRRIERLYRVCDMGLALGDTENGEARSAWSVIDSLADRGRLGYKDEEAVSGVASVRRTMLTLWMGE